MNRQQLLQDIINKNGVKNYLEIGTFQGDSFFPLKCKTKIAVDPEFKISRKKKLSWLLKNPSNLNNAYFEMTSDSFFKNKANILEKRKFGLVFIDGLHTFKASLLDVLNSLNYLKNGGYIVMHDCFPPHKSAATPAGSAYEARMLNKDIWPGDWCGDVWKTIVYLKSVYKEKLKILVVNADFGLGIISVQNNNLNLSLNSDLYDSINELNYEDLIRDPQQMINLMQVEDFKDLP